MSDSSREYLNNGYCLHQKKDAFYDPDRMLVNKHYGSFFLTLDVTISVKQDMSETTILPKASFSCTNFLNSLSAMLRGLAALRDRGRRLGVETYGPSNLGELGS